MYGIDIPLGTGDLQLILGGVVLARFQSEHLHFFLERQLLRDGFRLLPLLLLGQPTGTGITVFG